MNSELDKQLLEVLMCNTRLDPESIHLNEQSELIHELALDSILIVSLLTDLEETFHIEIKVEELTLPLLNDYSSLKQYIIGKTGIHI